MSASLRLSLLSAATASLAGVCLFSAAHASADQPFTISFPTGLVCKNSAVNVTVAGNGRQVTKTFTTPDGTVRMLSAGTGSDLTFYNPNHPRRHVFAERERRRRLDDHHSKRDINCQADRSQRHLLLPHRHAARRPTRPGNTARRRPGGVQRRHGGQLHPTQRNRKRDRHLRAASPRLTEPPAARRIVHAHARHVQDPRSGPP